MGCAYGLKRRGWDFGKKNWNQRNQTREKEEREKDLGSTMNNMSGLWVERRWRRCLWVGGREIPLHVQKRTLTIDKLIAWEARRFPNRWFWCGGCLFFLEWFLLWTRELLDVEARVANTRELVLELSWLKLSEVMALASWIGRTMEKGDKFNELAWLSRRGEPG